MRTPAVDGSVSGWANARTNGRMTRVGVESQNFSAGGVQRGVLRAPLGAGKPPEADSKER